MKLHLIQTVQQFVEWKHSVQTRKDPAGIDTYETFYIKDPKSFPVIIIERWLPSAALGEDDNHILRESYLYPEHFEKGFDNGCP